MKKKYTLIPTDFSIRDSAVIKSYYGKNIGDHIPLKEINKFLSLTPGGLKKGEEELILT